MTRTLDPWLLAGGAASAATALAHLGCIVGGASWYRAFGAGEPMARAVAAGHIWPIGVTVAIAVLLAVFAAYGLSGAGLLPRLPLLRTGLIAVAAIYGARGLVLFFPGLLHRPDLSPTFLFWSSAIVLAMALAYAVGTWRGWPSFNGVS